LYFYTLKGYMMYDGGVFRKLVVVLLIVGLLLLPSLTPASAAAPPELQITPEQQIEPTLIVPETGLEDAVFGGWLIWAILFVFGLAILIALVIRSGTPGRNP
jgi:hypothetical protein